MKSFVPHWEGLGFMKEKIMNATKIAIIAAIIFAGVQVASAVGVGTTAVTAVVHSSSVIDRQIDAATR
jgi:ABC-type proline/glycine betaine transport system permease subunit